MGISNVLSRWLIKNERKSTPHPIKGEGFSVHAIEFDDQGELWDPQQLDNTLKHIRWHCKKSDGGSANKENTEVIVITFIHGWLHNATPEDKNFESFTKLIRTRARAEKEFASQNNREARPIIGVYVAWRGLLLNIPLITFLTFWSRKTAALRVGNLSCTEVLFSIMRAVKSRNNRSQCIFVGHSFGGLIMENAICQALLGAIFQSEDSPVDSPSDLVVLINPAVEAIGAKQFIDMLERNKVRVKMGNKTEKDHLSFPLLVSITSVGDKATKWAFPAGQFFVGWSKSFRKYDNPPPGLPSQRHLHAHTAGHVTHFHNFKVEPIKGPIDPEKLEFSFNDGQDKYKIVPKSDDRKSLSFWLMQVPKEIVPDHSNIFTEAFENMLSSLLYWTMTSVEPTKIEFNIPEQSAP